MGLRVIVIYTTAGISLSNYLSWTYTWKSPHVLSNRLSLYRLFLPDWFHARLIIPDFCVRQPLPIPHYFALVDYYVTDTCYATSLVLTQIFQVWTQIYPSSRHTSRLHLSNRYEGPIPVGKIVE